MTIDPESEAFSSDTSIGIDVRTYLAAKAMQGLLANPLITKVSLADETDPEDVADSITWEAMIYADRLINTLNDSDD